MNQSIFSNNRVFSLLGLFLLMGTSSIWAQDPVFSQYNAAPMQLNPALTGLSAGPTFHLNYRNQWPSISQAYVTYAASYSQYMPTANSGIGVSVLADVAGNGIYHTTQIGMSYAYDLRFNEEFYIRTGLEGNFVNKRLNWDKLIFLDQIDIENGPNGPNGNPNPSQETQPVQNINYFDFGFGMMARTKHVFGGFALKHINAPEEGFLRANNTFGELPMRISVHAGGEIPLNAHNKLKKQAFLTPNALFVKQRQFHQLNLGAYIRYDVLIGGLSLRHAFGNTDAIIMMLGFQKGVIKMAYSYDLTVSRLSNSSGGAHEISLIMSFEGKRPNQDYNDCLKMFR